MDIALIIDTGTRIVAFAPGPYFNAEWLDAVAIHAYHEAALVAVQGYQQDIGYIRQGYIEGRAA